MNPQVERPKDDRPSSSNVSAAEQEDRLLMDLVAQLRRELAQAQRAESRDLVTRLPNLNTEDCTSSLAAELLRAIMQPCALAGHLLMVEASIGVAVFPRDGDNLSSLLRSADSAMYEAKGHRCGLALARPEVASA